MHRLHSYKNILNAFSSLGAYRVQVMLHFYLQSLVFLAVVSENCVSVFIAYRVLAFT